jgi:hypothetical protein
MVNETSFEALIDQLMAQFDVERSLCEADTKELLEQMVEKNIIRRVA